MFSYLTFTGVALYWDIDVFRGGGLEHFLVLQILDHSKTMGLVAPGLGPF